MCGGIGVGTGLSSVKGCISKDASFYRGILYKNGMKIHTLDNIPNKCLINYDSEYFKGVTGSDCIKIEHHLAKVVDLS